MLPLGMIVHGVNLLDDFNRKHADAKPALDAWRVEVESAQWQTPHDLLRKFPKADVVKNGHAIFNICWNKYRLLVQVAYKSQVVRVIRVGTHKEYNKWEI